MLPAYSFKPRWPWQMPLQVLLLLLWPAVVFGHEGSVPVPSGWATAHLQGASTGQQAHCITAKVASHPSWQELTNNCGPGPGAATVQPGAGQNISAFLLQDTAHRPGIVQLTFQELAQGTKLACSACLSSSLHSVHLGCHASSPDHHRLSSLLIVKLSLQQMHLLGLSQLLPGSSVPNEGLSASQQQQQVAGRSDCQLVNTLTIWLDLFAEVPWPVVWCGLVLILLSVYSISSLLGYSPAGPPGPVRVPSSGLLQPAPQRIPSYRRASHSDLHAHILASSTSTHQSRASHATPSNGPSAHSSASHGPGHTRQQQLTHSSRPGSTIDGAAVHVRDVTPHIPAPASAAVQSTKPAASHQHLTPAPAHSATATYRQPLAAAHIVPVSQLLGVPGQADVAASHVPSTYDHSQGNAALAEPRQAAVPSAVQQHRSGQGIEHHAHAEPATVPAAATAQHTDTATLRLRVYQVHPPAHQAQPPHQQPSRDAQWPQPPMQLPLPQCVSQPGFAAHTLEARREQMLHQVSMLLSQTQAPARTSAPTVLVRHISSSDLKVAPLAPEPHLGPSGDEEAIGRTQVEPNSPAHYDVPSVAAASDPLPGALNPFDVYDEGVCADLMLSRPTLDTAAITRQSTHASDHSTARLSTVPASPPLHSHEQCISCTDVQASTSQLCATADHQCQRATSELSKGSSTSPPTHPQVHSARDSAAPREHMLLHPPPVSQDPEAVHRVKRQHVRSEQQQESQPEQQAAGGVDQAQVTVAVAAGGSCQPIMLLPPAAPLEATPMEVEPHDSAQLPTQCSSQASSATPAQPHPVELQGVLTAPPIPSMAQAGLPSPAAHRLPPGVEPLQAVGGTWDASAYQHTTQPPFTVTAAGLGVSDDGVVAGPDDQGPPLGAADNLNRIVLLEMIGHGASGQVYRGRWLGQDVAVKTVLFKDKEETRKGSSPRQRAIMEAAVCKAMSHPHVVFTYCYDITPAATKPILPAAAPAMQPEIAPQFDWKLYLVQELCQATLRAALVECVLHDKESGSPFMDTILPLLLDIACGMEYVHSQNVIHGDLKPENVLLKAEPRSPIGMVAKVTDFGLCATIKPDQKHISNFTNGTPYYVAPEVVQHGQLTKTSDVYSFGVLMWVMYRCLPPWVPHGTGYVRNKQLGKYLIGTPPPYVLLTVRCMSKNPTHRPSFTEVRMALLSMLQSYEAGWDDLQPHSNPIIAISHTPGTTSLTGTTSQEASPSTAPPVHHTSSPTLFTPATLTTHHSPTSPVGASMPTGTGSGGGSVTAGPAYPAYYPPAALMGPSQLQASGTGTVMGPSQLQASGTGTVMGPSQLQASGTGTVMGPSQSQLLPYSPGVMLAAPQQQLAGQVMVQHIPMAGPSVQQQGSPGMFGGGQQGMQMFTLPPAYAAVPPSMASMQSAAAAAAGQRNRSGSSSGGGSGGGGQVVVGPATSQLPAGTQDPARIVTGASSTSSSLVNPRAC